MLFFSSVGRKNTSLTKVNELKKLFSRARNFVLQVYIIIDYILSNTYVLYRGNFVKVFLYRGFTVVTVYRE
jgi:hypothetical protein